MAEPLPPFSVTDDAWTTLAPIAVEVDAAERRVTRRLGVALALLVASVAAVLLSGVWTPRLAWSGAGGGTADAATRTGQVQFEVRNWGVVPVRVEGPATLSMAGVTATATTDGPVGPLARGVLRVELRVDDCARVPRSDPEAGSSVTVDVPMWHGIAPLTFGDVASSQLVAGVVDGICGRS